MDVDFSNHFLFEIGNTDVYFTQTQLSTLIIGAFLIALAIYVRIKLKNFQEVPTGFQNIIEIAVEKMDIFTKETMGEKYAGFGFWFFGVFAFLLIGNLSGLTGLLRPPTADAAATLALGITTFAFIHFFGITRSKKEYFKGYLDPMPVFLPLNIISEIATPISLSFRLFGNVLAGTAIMALLYAALPWFLDLIIPIPLHAYFDVFSGVLQSYIFVILSLTFIAQKLPE